MGKMMRTTIRKLGNSKGIIIPATFLTSLGIKKIIEIQIKNNSIIITPVQTREGWYDNYQIEKDDDAWQDFQSLESEENDWEW